MGLPRPAAARLSSQATALGRERPRVRCQRAVAGPTTLTHLANNRRALAPVRAAPSPATGARLG